MKKYISIDIGGTAIKYGIVSENAEVLLKKEMKTEAQKGGPAILEKVIGIVEELKGEADAGVYLYCRYGGHRKRRNLLFCTVDPELYRNGI